jgi:CRISPR-associated endonuclease Cas1
VRSPSQAFAPVQVKEGVLLLEGYGVRVYVERRHLVVEDGICEDRRWGAFTKAAFHAQRIRRVVILGHSGYVTLEALRWIHDAEAAILQVDRDGKVILASGPRGLDDPRLRRAQALAATNGVGVRIGRELVRRKLAGQLSLLDHLPGGREAEGTIRECLDLLDRAGTAERLRVVESRAASAYWRAWEEVPVQFVCRDLPRVPDHWRKFGQRSSPFANGPRLAGNPANALLNYLYAILETEARISLLAMGLDPGMGFLHADQPARDSLALDLMEAVRPEVDAYLLRMLQRQVFRYGDFFETREGVCRVLPPLVRVLASTAPEWARRIAPVAEWLSRELAKTSGSRIRSVPTPLTQSRRSEGREGVRRGPRKEPKGPAPKLLAFCRTCGAELPSPERVHCDACVPKVREEATRKLTVAGPRALARLRAEGKDPSHGGEAARKRAESLRRRQQEAEEWERIHGDGFDPEVFRREILPKLAGVPLSRMVKATGLSKLYCSLIRRGVYVPHPRHWEALRNVLDPTSGSSPEPAS